MKALVLVPMVLALAACGAAGGGGKGAAAATACDAFAKQKLSDKTYTLDQAALAASMKEKPDGTALLKAPIIIDPGLTSEVKQSVECSVRFTAGKDKPDVLNMNFIW